ncbi:LysR family transcriptional regulator [Paraburkholderia sp. SIMBA_030]|uniref:LysR family transcriptional regulator n=1 Tax=Paraburkholderia sp. SIMBA_030 TaxID=3085773 RepID=UPI00397AA32F
MNLRQLEVFHAIMQSGSVTGAARALNVSQPAISAVLKHAEQRLGMKLFERISGRLSPTPEASALLPDVDDIFSRIDTLSRTMQAMRDGRTGRILVATTPTLANGIFPRVLGLFRKQSPNVHVSLRSVPTPLAIEAVGFRHADMGVIYGPVDNAGVESEFLATTEIVCALPRRHRLTRKKTITFKDLVGESVISIGATTMLGKLIDNAARLSGTEVPAATIDASSSLTACLLVAEGVGVALVDRTVITSPLVFRPFLPTVSVSIQLIFPHARPRSRATQSMSEVLKRVTKAVPGPD